MRMIDICHKDLKVEKSQMTSQFQIAPIGNLVLIGLLPMRELNMAKWVKDCELEPTQPQIYLT